MKKTTHLFSYACLIVLTVLCSCSQVRYTHLNRIPRDKQLIDQQSVLNEIKNAEEKEVILTKNESIATPDIQSSEAKPEATKIFSESVKTNAPKSTVTKNAAMSVKSKAANSLALKVMSKLPNKLKASFAEKKNIAATTSPDESRSSILYIVVVVLLVLFLVGLIGGNLGGLIYLVLVVALVLLLLRLLGIF